MPRGRPRKAFIPKIGDQILERWMFSTFSIERVIEEFRAANPACPSLRIFWSWVKEEKEFSQDYARAREFRAHYLADKAVDEALTPRKGVYSKKSQNKSGEVTIELREDDNVARSRLVAEMLMKRASQLFPREYRENRHDSGGEAGVNEQLEALHRALLDGPAMPDEEEPETVEKK